MTYALKNVFIDLRKREEGREGGRERREDRKRETSHVVPLIYALIG